MKKVLSFFLALAMTVTMATFAVGAADGFVSGEPVALPNTDKVTLEKTGVQVWSGNVEFDNPASAVTFVFRFTGVNEPIVATKVNPGFIEANGESYAWSEGSVKKRGPNYGGYQWGNIWGGIYAPEMNIEEDGVYYLYLNRKVLANNESLSIKNVTSFSLFNTEGSIPGSKSKPVNKNENAAFQMLAIVPNDLSATVDFYDGSKLLTTQSLSYTNYGNVTTGDQTTGITDGINNKKARQFGTLVTPDDLFLKQNAVEIPAASKFENGKLYRRVWKNEAGDIVDGIYESGKLTLDYVETATTHVDVTFVDENGEKIYKKNILKTELAYEGAEPEKASDGDYTYTFAGWSVDGENTVDLSTYKIADDVLEVTFIPVFKSDLILKASLVGEDEIPMGKGGTYKIKLNRTDISTDVVAGTKEPITNGSITVSYPARALSVQGQSVSGDTAKTTVKFNSVTDEGIAGEVTLNALEGFAGALTVSLSGNAGKTIAATEQKLTVTGQLPGYYIPEPTTVKIPKTDGNTAPAKQSLWSGNAYFDGADAVSFVYKIDGVESEINAYQLALSYNGSYNTATGQEKIWNGADEWGGARSPRYHSFTDNGYYVLYINNCLIDGASITSVNDLSIFNTSTTYPANNEKDTPVNTNENATFTMLAVVGDALSAQITFHDANGGVIGEPQSVCYVDESTFSTKNGAYTDGNQVKQTVKLSSASEIFAKTGAKVPEKAADGCYAYKFAGWQDVNGNPIDAVYMNTDAYPVYEKEIVDPVKVKFQNGGETLSEVDFPRAGYVSFAGNIPEKADDANNSYQFIGWTTDPAKTLASTPTQAEEYPIDLSAVSLKDMAQTGGALTLYAVFEKTERMWNIRFLGEDEAEIALLRVRDGKLVLQSGEETAAPTTPEKAADRQYTYTPNGWATKDGKSVVDKNGKLVGEISADMTVYPAYEKKANSFTVLFLDDDKQTELASVEVEYGGTVADMPKEPTKESTDYYSYKFAGWVDEAGKAVTLENITEDMSVYANYTQTYLNPFVDVKEGAYYYTPVEYSVVNGIMNGTDKTHFTPNGISTRAQLVSVLWRIEGRPPADGLENPFADLGAKTAYYYDAVLWAYDKGLVKGVSATEFRPNDKITREQFVTILYRYAKELKGYYVGYGKSSYSSFPDKDAVHDYASEAFCWAVATTEDLQSPSVDPALQYNKTQYISGVKGADGKDYLMPGGDATRAQMVTMLYRFLSGDQVYPLPDTASGLMLCEPSVYAVEDEYQICVAVNKETTMWVEIDGKSYYDHTNGILRSDKFLHKASVPMEVLDNAQSYTVYLREIIERKPYYTVCGGVESKKYNFRPVREKDHYNIINLADSHGLAAAAMASGSYFGKELDLLVMNGDIIDSSNSIDAFKTIYRISGGITKGEVPCVYSRGNHELRGLAAEQLADYTPTNNGKSYYTFRLGPIWGMVLDAGEDKADSNAEYGNTVACEPFRDEEGKFLDGVIASKEWGDASVKLIISHVPLAIKSSAPYNSEDARYAEWTRKIAAIEPTLWMTGHYHQCFFELPGERKTSFGYPCPFLCSSYKDNATNSHTSGAVIITNNTITARYVTEKGEVNGERTVNRIR